MNSIKCPSCDIKIDIEDENDGAYFCPNCGHEWSGWSDEIDNDMDFGDTIFDINPDFEDQ